MIPTVKKCECGRVSNPLQTMIVSNAWVDKRQVAHFEFPCPQCKKINTVKADWKIVLLSKAARNVR